jgi:hypothetical protein
VVLQELVIQQLEIIAMVLIVLMVLQHIEELVVLVVLDRLQIVRSHIKQVTQQLLEVVR